MPTSMTGFGRASTQEEHWTISWEIRSLNNRHLDLKWKIPPTLYALQKDWENDVRTVAKRGSIELFLALKITTTNLQSISLDTASASAMLEQLQALAASKGCAYTPDLNRLLNIPSLWKDSGPPEDPALTASLATTLRQALQDWQTSRKNEGAALTTDLRTRLEHIRALVVNITHLVQKNVPERAALLHERIEKLLSETGMHIDENRLLQEIALLADRVDVCEELTRLDVHVRTVEETLALGGLIGRKLDFMIQECFREINTCGNKCQNSAISQLVVDVKAELEKCREQIQNLE